LVVHKHPTSSKKYFSAMKVLLRSKFKIDPINKWFDKKFAQFGDDLQQVILSD